MNIYPHQQSSLAIRKANPNDFEKVIGCVRDVYGSFYCRQEIYHESCFNEKIGNGEWIIFMVETENDTAGIIGFLRPLFCERVYEFGLFIVKNMYQKLGIGTEIFDYAVKLLNETEHPVEYTNVTTLTISSQNLVEKRTAFICTGFLLAAVHEGSDNLPKETLAFYALKRQKQSCGELYIPQEIKKAAEIVYTSLDVEYSLQMEESPLQGETVFGYYFDKYADTLYINITKCGVDMMETIRSLEQKYNSDSLFSVIIYLNIKNAASIAGHKKLIDSGYVFSGFKPLYYEYEYSILCSLMDVKIDFGELKLTQKTQSMLREVINLEKI